MVTRACCDLRRGNARTVLRDRVVIYAAVTRIHAVLRAHVAIYGVVTRAQYCVHVLRFTRWLRARSAARARVVIYAAVTRAHAVLRARIAIYGVVTRTCARVLRLTPW